MRKVNKHNKMLSFMLILFILTVGYAFLSARLTINGIANIKSNVWDIHWENVQPNNESTINAETPVIDSSRTVVSYTVQLALPGDFYEFTVDAVNSGTIDGEITKIDHDVFEEDGVTAVTLPDYFIYTVYYDGTETKPALGDVLSANGGKQTYRVRLEYDPNYDDTIPDEKTYKIIDKFTYSQALSENNGSSSNNNTSTENADPATDARFGNDTSGVVFSNTSGNGQAKLDLGETTNMRLKKVAALANGVSEDVLNQYTVYDLEDTYISSIVWSDTEPTEAQKVPYGQLAMSSASPLGMDADGTTNEMIESDVPIYAWYSNGTIYIWSSDSTIDMHPHSERMFQGMKNLTNISGLSHFVSNEVTTMRYMFKDTKVSNFSSINSWSYVKVKASLKHLEQELPGNNGFYHICNGIPNNAHMTISTPIGTWNNEGTYLPRDLRFYSDLTGDGRVTQEDADILYNYNMGVITSIPKTCGYDFCGDVDGDGRVGPIDIYIIRMFVED